MCLFNLLDGFLLFWGQKQIVKVYISVNQKVILLLCQFANCFFWGIALFNPLVKPCKQSLFQIGFTRRSGWLALVLFRVPHLTFCIYYTTLSVACQGVFESFLRFFAVALAVHLSHFLYLLYHALGDLSRGFQNFFQIFFCPSEVAPPLITLTLYHTQSRKSTVNLHKFRENWATKFVQKNS